MPRIELNRIESETKDKSNKLNRCRSQRSTVTLNHSIAWRLITGLGVTYPASSPHSFNNKRYSLTPSAMPLLSLPVELLADIANYAIGQPFRPGEISCTGEASPIHRGCTHPPASSIAHTCQLLRSLTIPLMYESVIAHLEFMPTLHALLTSESGTYIATSVRSLTVFVTDAQVVRLLHDIVACCTHLQDLRLDGSYADGHPATTLLAPIGPQLSLDLKNFQWDEILAYLSAAPHRLHTLRLFELASPHRVRPALEPPIPAPQLASVHSLVCATCLFDLGTPDGGAELARMLPNVDKVKLYITPRSMLMLEAFVELGTRLTQLTVSCYSSPRGFCDVVAKLAPSLERYTASGGGICERLVKADWARLEYFNVVVDFGCDDPCTNVLRAGLVKLVADRPRAEITVMMDSTELVTRKEWGLSVASQEVFDQLKVSSDCTYGTYGAWSDLVLV